ncbi:hypothetical protein DSM25559_0440 [Agrobacterium rosae]|uniref:Uncharacterized protein n=1 Tax=Agrobacterium rosae TaxID=1972867 RepID=A0A1R3T906_9HYPH|nr:hypothetical protein DSM25559_0440 [Agrobacterium rosae]
MRAEYAARPSLFHPKINIKSFLHAHQPHAYNPHTFAAGVFRETLSGQAEGGDWP